MDVRICPSCKKMFQYVGGPVLCAKCREAEEEMFKKVKDYLRENPGAEFGEINKETGVTLKLIEKFLKEGRLEVIEGSPLQIKCEKCGRKISSGRYCNACRKKMNKTIEKMRQSMLPEIKKDIEDEKARMRYLKSDNINR